jgi:DNA integrity scanning protein DisA with diadenylate cyclase activity
LTQQTNEDEAMSDLPRMVSVALESSKFAFDAVLMVSNDSRKVRSIVPVLPKNVPLRVMTSLNRVRDALIEHQIDAQVLEEGLSSKGLSVLSELYDLVLQGMGERWVAKGGRLLIVMAEPIDGVLVIDSAMLGAGRLASIAEEQSIELDVLMRMVELSRAVGTRGREGSAVGALFAIGNIQKMRGHSTSMVLNPFKGHSIAKRDVRIRENHETMAEFAWLDGAILFNREGIASDAGRYIQVPAGLSPKSGEGGRHLAARAISQLSDGVAIAVSSTGSIVLYANGRERYRVRIK